MRGVPLYATVSVGLCGTKETFFMVRGEMDPRHRPTVGS